MSAIWMLFPMHAHLEHGKLLQDLVSDFDKGLDWDVVAQRGAMENPPIFFSHFVPCPAGGKIAAMEVEQSFKLVIESFSGSFHRCATASTAVPFPTLG